MMHEVKQFIDDTLNELYPQRDIVDESVPQNFKEGTFLITFDNQEYEKLVGNTFNCKVLIDISYWTESQDSPREECLAVQQDILRALAIKSIFRAKDLKANVVDEVLHITFSISYREAIQNEEVTMQQQQTNTSI